MDTSKIIRGVVSNGRYTVTAPIVKEDYGLYLQIEGVELPSTYEVDFSNSEHSGASVTMIGNADGVLIPSQFIETGKDVFAFLYHVGSDFGRTVYKFRIPNKVRPGRTNKEPTPEEQSVIDQAINALNEAVAKTAQDVIDADASAQSASADADKAEEARTDAQNYATQAEQARDDAQTYANNAQTSANNASQSASQASASATASAQNASQSAQIKTDVESLADDAQGYAQASAQSATASANSATTAQGFAQSASASAQSASGYASNAQTSANTASAKAQDASGYAQTATQKATESAQSASDALTYKTDAESAKTASQTAQGLAESARDSAVSAKTDAESAKADAESARDEAVQAVASISGALDNKADVITDTASGAIASFSDGADDLPLKSLVVDINPVQDLHGQANPYPAGGGKNKFGNYTVLNAYINSAGEIKTSVNDRAYVIACKPNTTYTFKAVRSKIDGTDDVHGGTYSTVERPTINSTGTRFPGTNYNSTTNLSTFSFTTGENDKWIVLKILNATKTNEQATLDTVQVEEGSSVSEYSPYENICPISGWTSINVNHSDADTTNPTTITINLGQTVYGGKLDVLSGKLTIDRAMVDLGTLDWTIASGASSPSGKLFRTVSNIAKPRERYTPNNVICTIYKTAGQNVWFTSDYLDLTVGIGNAGKIVVRDDRYDNDTTAFKSAVSGVQLVYELAEPIEIQLSANQINSLLGVNNIWADSGDTEVEYRADTKLFIERLTAPDSADMVADANITSGKYFMVGNSLYKATANIANGGQIIVGTNCIRKSLSEALNEINA